MLGCRREENGNFKIATYKQLQGLHLVSCSLDRESILLSLQSIAGQASQQGDQGFHELLVWDLQTLKRRTISRKMPGALETMVVIVRAA